jgi:hypothetical protein
MTISGTSFPEVAEELVVSMGARRCEVQTASSTQVTCVVPTNPPGDVDVIVDTQNKGNFELRPKYMVRHKPFGWYNLGKVFSLNHLIYCQFSLITQDELPWTVPMPRLHQCYL